MGGISNATLVLVVMSVIITAAGFEAFGICLMLSAVVYVLLVIAWQLDKLNTKT